jgi:RNA polymerase sigma factor (sigma-70 family)
MNQLIYSLRRGALLRDGAGLTDGQLLECYVRQREGAAFAALVRRHGPMVWGVCRRVLGNHHDAEDAFQATFLVLVRKAPSVRPREMVANWLYGVAHRTALKVRATIARRRARERQVPVMAEVEMPAQDFRQDLERWLDQELSCLPEKYRAPIVLCELEGKTYREAARQLGCPEGTLSARLARGRALLAKRLARHGLGMSGGALAAVLASNVGSACPPARVVSSTVQAAHQLAAGYAVAGLVPAKVAALTEGVLKAMLFNKLKVVTAIVVLASIGGAGAGRLFDRTPAAEPVVVHAALKPASASEKAHPRMQAQAADEPEFLKELLRIEREAVPFPEDKDPQVDPNIGYYPPAKALVEKAKEAAAVREAREGVHEDPGDRRD